MNPSNAEQVLLRSGGVPVVLLRRRILNYPILDLECLVVPLECRDQGHDSPKEEPRPSGSLLCQLSLNSSRYPDLILLRRRHQGSLFEEHV
jgi:hypothetical protein